MAGISVQINPGKDMSTSTATASGSFQHVITDNEVKSFGLQDGSLKDAVGKYFGKNPDDAYLKSPTPWNDLYSTYGWPQTTTTIIPVNAVVVSVDVKPIIVATQRFINSSGKAGTFNVSISQQVTNTVESNWSTTKTVDVSQTINYGISFLGTGGGGSTSFSYSQAWAQGGSESDAVTLGSTQAVTVVLDPNESVTAQLTASQGSITVDITYQATLSGDTAINYGGTYKDHHFWGLDLPSVMSSGGIANVITFTETITIDYYFDSEVKLINSSVSGANIVPAKAAEAPSLQGVAV